MKFTFHTKWVQNIILILTILAAAYISLFERQFIMSLTSPERFFWLMFIAAILLAMNILYMLTISARAHAIANERTADLLETQKLFVELYRNSPVPYVLVNHKGKVTYPNHAASRLFGLSEKSFEGLNIFEMIEVLNDEDGMKISLVASRFSQGVFVDSKDVLIRRDDGTTRYGLLSIFSYGDFGRKKKGLMTIVDITKQKEIEKTKSEFVSLASHQLRTPISSMQWNLELMSSPQFGTLTSEQGQYLGKIENGLIRMSLVIEDFLSVSQLELGTKPVTFENVSLVEFFDEIYDEFSGRISDKNIRFIKQYDERISTIETDKRLMHMAVSNLVSNATKYTPENGEVTVRYVSGTDTITISVTDTGVGIPTDEQEHLFNKFFRASNVQKQIPDGTGLGLYIVKLAIEKLGGKITMKSKENVGTAFDIVLPYSSSGRML